MDNPKECYYFLRCHSFHRYFPTYCGILLWRWYIFAWIFIRSLTNALRHYFVIVNVINVKGICVPNLERYIRVKEVNLQVNCPKALPIIDHRVLVYVHFLTKGYLYFFVCTWTFRVNIFLKFTLCMKYSSLRFKLTSSEQRFMCFLHRFWCTGLTITT